MNQILSNHDKDSENLNNSKARYSRNPINRSSATRKQSRNNYYGNHARYYNDRYSERKRLDQQYRRNNYYNRTQKAELVKIARVFAIVLLVYALAIIGQSVYALNSSQYKPKDNVVVTLDKMGKEVTLAASAVKPIKEIRYRWNDGEETKIQGNGRNKIEQIIDAPNGNNTLNVTVSDYYGNKSSYQRQFLYESKDSIKPNIETSVSGTKITLTVSDETKLSYITYKWNDESETRYDVPNGQKLVTLEIEVMKGKNTFTINAVDEDDNKTTFSKMIIGDTKPEVSILTEGSNVIVKAKDDEGIAKLEIKIDGEVSEEETGNNTEINAKIPVSAGTHEIKAIVTNVNGLKASKEITADI